MASFPGPPRTPAGRSWLEVLGVLAIAASLGWVAGPGGLLAAAIVAATWWLLSPVAAVAAGHVVALPVLPGALDPAVVVAVEVGYLGILGGPALRGPDRLTTLSVVELSGIGLGAIAWVGWHALQPDWLSGAIVVAAVGLGMYGIHRYSVVSLERRGVTAEP